jgi:hypothetical protein
MAVIPQCDLIGQAALSQRVGKGGTHRAGADNHNFSRFPGSILHRSFSVPAHAFRSRPHVRRSLEFQTAFYSLDDARRLQASFFQSRISAFFIAHSLSWHSSSTK